MNVFISTSIAAAALSFGMVALWFVQRRTKNAGIVDVGWTFGVAAAGVFLALMAPGDGARRVVVASLYAIWGLRLGSYLFVRVVGHPEEGRYATLRSQWGAHAERHLFSFFQLQAAAALLFAWPASIAGASSSSWSVLDWVGVAIWASGILGVTIADRQLAAFKRDPANKGKTCRVGLWRMSRHPNYFFEWLLWWSYVLLSSGNPWWPLAAIIPIVLLYFFLFVTGIPPTEAQAIATRGDDYRDYQRTTSPFIPWFPRERTHKS